MPITFKNPIKMVTDSVEKFVGEHLVKPKPGQENVSVSQDEIHASVHEESALPEAKPLEERSSAEMPKVKEKSLEEEVNEFERIETSPPPPDMDEIQKIKQEVQESFQKQEPMSFTSIWNSVTSLTFMAPVNKELSFTNKVSQKIYQKDFAELDEGQKKNIRLFAYHNHSRAYQSQMHLDLFMNSPDFEADFNKAVEMYKDLKPAHDIALNYFKENGIE